MSSLTQDLRYSLRMTGSKNRPTRVEPTVALRSE